MGASVPFKATSGQINGCVGISECDERLHSNHSAIQKVDAKQIELKISDVAVFRYVVDKEAGTTLRVCGWGYTYLQERQYRETTRAIDVKLNNFGDRLKT